MICAWCGYKIEPYSHDGSPFIWMHTITESALYGYCDNPISGMERPSYRPIRPWRRAEPEDRQSRLI